MGEGGGCSVAGTAKSLNPPAIPQPHSRGTDQRGMGVNFPPVVTLGTKPEDTSQAQLCSAAKSRQECRDQGPKLA